MSVSGQEPRTADASDAPGRPGTPAQAGWYPCPWNPALLRWWDGRAWTGYQAHAAGTGEETDGVAVASLVTALTGLFPVAVVLGFLARHRIRTSQRRTGRGLANAGIAVGAAGTVLAALLAALAVNGAFDETNADDFSGQEQEVARVVDSFEAAWEDGDGATVCSEIFTEDLAAFYDDADRGPCVEEWGADGYVDIDLSRVEITGASATAHGKDADVDWSFNLSYVDGEWRICGLESS